MASFGPQVKNMAQVGAGREQRKPLQKGTGRCGVHRSDSLSSQSRPACSHRRPVPSSPRGPLRRKSYKPPETPSHLLTATASPLSRPHQQ